MIQASSGFPPQRCCIKCSPTLTGMFVVFVDVDDLHFLGVLGFGCADSAARLVQSICAVNSIT